MALIKTCSRRNEIIKWENLYIQKYSTEGKLIQEQIPHRFNILFTLSRTDNNADRKDKLGTAHDRQSVPPQIGDTTRRTLRCTNQR
jgi:hypothetical protein